MANNFLCETCKHKGSRCVPCSDGTCGAYETLVSKICLDDNIPGVYSAKLRYVARIDNARYVAKDDGIYLLYDEIDNYEEIVRTIEKLVLSKDAFVAAYNAYIKGE